MRATLWMAASGFLLAAGSAYAGNAQTTGPDDSGYTEEATGMTSPAQAGVSLTEGTPQTAAQDVSKTENAQPRVQEKKAEARSDVVTVDPDHPGGEFPYGG